MSKPSKKGKKDDEPEETNICRNRRALHDYEILDTIECGVVLVGTEVKALREGLANLEDAYAKVDRDEVWLVGCEIREYSAGNRMNHKPKRERKLLMRRAEITKFADQADQKGFTLVPLRLYFRGGYAKVEIAVAKGKQTHDKRQTLKKAEAKREMDRATASRRRKS
jgi:SsrA-binding protein